MNNNKDFERFTLYEPPIEPHPDTYCIGIDLPIEKIYQFKASSGFNDYTVSNFKESELEQKHKDLLIGQLIKDFEDLPNSLKQQTLNILNERNERN